MSPAKNHALILVILLASHFVVVGNVVAVEPTADSARSILQKRGFPWYDAANDTFRPLRPVEEPTPPPTTNTPPPTVGSSGLEFLPQIAMWVLLTVLIGTILTIVIRTMKNFEPLMDSGSDPVTAKIDLEALEALPEPTRGVHDLLGEAARLAAQSLYGKAMTFYYSWQLMRLNEQQLIEIQKGKTNRQYSREIRVTKPELLDLFAQSMRLFEDAFFGNLSVSREDFQRVWDERDKFTKTPRRSR